MSFDDSHNYLQRHPYISYMFFVLSLCGALGHVALGSTITFHNGGKLMRKVSYRLLVLQLLTDFMWVVWVGARSAWVVAHDYSLPWQDHSHGCDAEGVLLTLCFHSSLFLTALIAYDRYRMITNPLKPLQMQQAMKLYALSLLWAVCCTLLHGFALGGYTYTTGSMYCLVVSVNTVLKPHTFFY
jgi:hypothetical protein